MNRNLQRAMVLLEQSNHGKAADELRQVLADDPDDSTAHALLAICLAQAKHYGQATDEAQQAIHLAPDTPLSHYSMAVVMNDRNRFQEALTAIDEAIRIDPYNSQYHALAASLQFQMRDWKRALASANIGLQANPEDSICNNLRSMALVKLGRNEEAHQTLDSILAKSPDNALTHANQGWALLESNQHEKAMEHFREALRLAPDLEYARAGILTAMRARNPIYRWLLKFFLAMSKLTQGGQWAVIIGLFLGYRILRQIAQANPQWAWLITPLLILYVGFALLTWIANPLFNLVLRLDKFGKLALSKQEVIASNFIGVMLLIALGSLIGFFATGIGVFLAMAVVSGLLIMPVSGTFNCEHGWPRNVMTACTAGLLLVGLGAMSLWGASPGIAQRLLILFSFGVLASTFVGNAMMGTQVRH